MTTPTANANRRSATRQGEQVLSSRNSILKTHKEEVLSCAESSNSSDDKPKINIYTSNQNSIDENQDEEDTELSEDSKE